MLGCALVSGALTFVIIVMLAMIPSVRGFVRSSLVKLVGGSVQRVTIPEGWNRFQVASRLENQGVVASSTAFLKATEDPVLLDSLGISSDSVEGYLFPDTYDFYRVSEPEDVVEKFVSNYLIQFRNVSRRHSRALRELGSLGDDPEHVAVILAS
ncbi:MAG: endolytic transglycosylase MltG, partial [Deltaproteobacteria bacterium]|nr:endolytic transglycosylase MltG [Deltaproteobacteria bacterium]